jgi:hypothetical protein
MVGARRFELLTFCTPSKRATRLRYAPPTIHIPTMPSYYRQLTEESLSASPGTPGFLLRTSLPLAPTEDKALRPDGHIRSDAFRN